MGSRRAVLGVAAAILVIAAVAASQLRSVSSADLLVGDRTQEAKASTALDRTFGQDPIVVSVRGDLRQLLGPTQLTGLLELEGKLAGLPGVKAVYGPGTFLNQTVIQANQVVSDSLGGLARQARTVGDAARQRVVDAGGSRLAADEASRQAIRTTLGPRAKEYTALLNQFGTVGLPDLANTSFVNGVVFGAGTAPKARFRWLFPDNGHALVLVRPDAGVGGADMLRLRDRIEALTRSAKAGGKGVENRVQDASFRVAGLPVLAASLERETKGEVLRLTPVAVGVMLLLLLVVLRRRRGRFAALVSALGAVVLTLGLSWPLGLGLSVATVAALPVVLGLGLDFAVQTQARYWLERRRGLEPDAAAEAARRGVAPTLALASGAMALGFVVLMAGPVPVIDRLGAVLAVGVLSAAALAILVVPALLVLLDRGSAAVPLALPVPDRLVRARLHPVGATVLVALAIGGLAVSGAVRLQSDLTVLSPRGLTELRDVEALQRDVGTAGQVSVAIRGDDVTRPDVLRWMNGFAGRARAAEPRLKPGPNLADLVTGGDPTAKPDRQQVDAQLGLLPPYFLSAVLSGDRRTAELTYTIPFVSVAEQGRIAGRVHDALGSLPAGISATPTGLVVESATSARQLDGSRPWLLLLAAAAISLALWARWRDLRRVALVLSPALLAAGLSTLVMALADVTLSPLGAALEPLVLAIGLEFGMLLDMGYRQARRRGLTPAGARRVTTRDIGGAVALSAATVAAGFAVLSASRLPLLSQLGWLVALELALCLVVAVVVVPLMAEWLDGGARRPRGRPAAPPATQAGETPALSAVGTPSS